ncbi:MAG: Ig-like domain-containing protein, partial [Bacteroidetes bacterium]|nr:Ig-like domain-containing protein [Bacteroidota bacterium]
VDRRSVQDAVFISPNISNIEYDWSGTEVEIIFNEKLQEKTTYVITVGTDVVDVNNHNRMAKAFSFAFSTGEKIDINSIQGKVIDNTPEGVMIFSYRLNGINPDTLNPKTTKPNFITQTGKSGEFTLTNLSDGTYRLFAIRDEYKNLLYDPETDAAGTLTEDVTVGANDTLKTGLQFMLAKEDTTSPRISNVTATDNRHLSVQFSEKIDTNGIRASMFSVTDTNRRNMLNVQQVIPQHDLTTIVLLTAKQEKDSSYLLAIEGVKDEAGHIINPAAKQKLFTGSALDDTLPPAVIFSSVQDSSAVILQNDGVSFEFSDVLNVPVNSSAVQWKRMKDSSTVPFNLRWMNAASFVVQPKSPLPPNEQFQIQLSMKYFSDLFSHTHRDTVRRYPFRTIDPDQFGSIEGKCTAEGFSQNVIIEADNISQKEHKPHQTELRPDASFSFPLLTEGRYVLKAYVDTDKNKKLSAGKVFPYQRSEKFLLYPDTIKVRARWPVDGVMIR